MAHSGRSWRLPVPGLCHHAFSVRSAAGKAPSLFLASRFSTSAAQQYPLPPKKKGGGKLPAKGVKGARQKKKSRAGVTLGSKPARGERKASKKRIVLSNVNALEVTGLEDLEQSTSLDSSMQGKILGLPGMLVDRLRAAGAFKPTQSWAMFKRPTTLVRPETVEVANIIGANQKGSSGQRIILTGERGSGKSVLLLQTQALALLKDWIVITLPEGEQFLLFQ